MMCSYAEIDSVCSQGCAGTSCAPDSWLVTRIDDRATSVSVAIDPLERPHIAYFHDADLRVASRTDQGWLVTPVDLAVGLGRVSLLADGSGGLHVLYEEYANHNVRYAYRAFGAASFSVEFVATAGDVTPLAMALDAQGIPHVAYFDRSNAQIVVVVKRGTSWTITHSMPGGGPSIIGELKLGPSGEPYLVVTNFRYNGNTLASVSTSLALPTQNSWTLEALPGKFVAGFVRRASGEMHVLLNDLTVGLSAHHRSLAGAWTTELVDPTNYRGGGASSQGELSLDAQGVLHVGYYRVVPSSSTYGIYLATYGGGSWSLERVYDDPSHYRAADISMAYSLAGVLHFAAVDDVSEELFHLERY